MYQMKYECPSSVLKVAGEGCLQTWESFLPPFFLNSKILVAMEALGFAIIKHYKNMPLLIYINYSEFPIITYNCIWVYND